ncbi:diol dehydratase small subunit [Escherichia coli]|uniref:diol dehydratase small subunit n=1 Tax=Escherichia coli TaxID=562 RepID=UPI00287968CB|nr:diol dehydratase small subunit [Escherichia coli]MDS1470340.1 diol dehydratase small subunit [Escherichia coli]
MNSLQDAAPVSAVPNASILSAKVTDYPLANKHPEWVKTATNKTLDDFTLENVLSDNVTALDMRITPETLRIQAAIARDAGRDRLAMNFERAAELTSVPDDRILEIVDANDSWVTCEQLMPMLPIVKVNDFDSALTLALKVEDGLHHTAIMHSQNVSRLNLAARVMQTSIFVKNGPSWAGIGVGGEGFTTFTIATPTGEGTTSARTFARSRRCVLTSGFSIR